MHISLYNHRGSWVVSDSLKEKVIELIRVEGEQFSNASIYFMKDSTTKYETKNKRDLNIFFGATPGEFKLESYLLNTDTNTYAIEMMVCQTTDYASLIIDEKGQVIGYYAESHSELYVPFKIDELAPEIVEEIVIHIMKQFKKAVLDEFMNKDSWMKSKQQDVLRQRITEHLSAGKETRINELKYQIKDTEDNIQVRTRQLKERYDALIRMQQELERAENEEVNGLDNFIKGLDQIAQHPQVSNVLVVNDLITIYIDNVYAYARVKGKERRYYIGNMHVKININNTDIRFFGDNGRHGLWTTHDPHPHVNGGDGRACLGNVASTIAQLCSQKEIYPLFLVCLDFLENANTEDSAGKKIVRWDEVDEDGNIIEEAKNNIVYCDHCEEPADEEEMYTVYTDFSDGDLLNEERWCEGCRDNNASFADCVDEIVHDEIYQYVCDYFSDDDDDEEEDF